MTKWLNAFLEFKNEANATRKFALFAVVIITLGLISLSVTGIVATATWTWLSFLPIIGLILAVVGAELMSTVAFVRSLAAPTLKRKIAGYIISFGLAWVGVHNAENGVKVVWPDRFAESASSLAAKANLAGDEASTLGEAQTAAIAASGGELERVRTQIAQLAVEQRKMAAQSPEGIKEAQALLLAQGKYFGSVDGIRQDLTEAAMRARGEELQAEIATLKQRENSLMAGQASPVQQSTTDRRLQQIDLMALAEAAFWAALWLAVMLWTLEGCRSLGLWALVTDVTGADVDDDRQREKEIKDALHRKALAEIGIAVTPPPAPEPVAATPAPLDAIKLNEPLPEPELTDAQRRGRAGGLGNAQKQAATKAKNERLILVPSFVARDAADLQAAKVAAE